MLRKLSRILILFTILISFSCQNKITQSSNGGEPWSDAQLMEPAHLASIINSADAPKPVIFSLSPDGMYGLPENGGIKGAITIGPTEDKANLKKLKSQLQTMDKDADIVIYCGCCPFKDCPNIRPAFRLLNDMHFTNHKLLDLRHNIQEDWISKGYPMKN